MKTTEQAERAGSRGPRHSPDAPRRRAEFTLVELLVVIVIMTIIMALVVPAFKNFGGGVSGASRMVGSQLRLARQYAIAHRKKVAVILPGPISGSPPAGLQDKLYVAFRAARWDSTNNIYQPIPGTKWEFLPTGSIIAEADDDYIPDETATPWTPNDRPGGTTLIDFDRDGDGTADYTSQRAVVFRPTGQLEGGQRYVTIVDGFVSGTQLTIKNRDNYVIIGIDQYTGRVSYEKNL